jgi:hypothetical protein
MAPQPDRFEAARKDFDLAVEKAKTAVNASTDPAITNLIFALGRYSRSAVEMMIAISTQLDEIERQLRNVAARLDGKKGPFDLHMRK